MHTAYVLYITLVFFQPISKHKIYNTFTVVTHVAIDNYGDVKHQGGEPSFTA